ncbi:MAG: hypothetical protein HRU18_26045 [Pseudoalteromonas sp.]|uniref:hypothetical protein n=1 Tax=Pseudoalteromonas sp. TaxID=53249 RepID=UPI001D56686E|nr:hypothetical protein [Pseudoalteromonas sp.]NRA81676.1 hypothetical protein [Pseudoalteromonas sp.]
MSERLILSIDKIDVIEMGKLYERYTGSLNGYEFKCEYRLSRDSFLKLNIVCRHIQIGSAEVNVQVKMECAELNVSRTVNFIAVDTFKNGAIDFAESLVANAMLRNGFVNELFKKMS